LESLSKQIALIATLVAVGAVTRFGLGELAMVMPQPFYGVVIKVGLTETLTFMIGFAYGVMAGITGGALIIIISDIMFSPGPWTPFIAAIIGLVFGIGAGVIRRFENGTPGVRVLGVSAVILTVVSETLQNSWVAVFYGVPLTASMISGIPSLIAALVNNALILTAVGPRVITAIGDWR
jgi:hypothetical protein